MTARSLGPHQLLPADLADVVARWAAGELASDAIALDEVLHPQFLFAGPVGYLLDRREWLRRCDSGDPHETRFDTFDFTPDIPARVVGHTALVVGTQTQSGTNGGEAFDGRLRGTLVLVRDPRWLIVGLHLSSREPPAAW